MWLYLGAALVYALDRGTKLWAEHALHGRPPITLIPDVLRLTYTTNSGGAFGLGQSAPWIFATATFLVAIAIIVASARLSRLATALGLGSILGGALGNLTDRLVHGHGFLAGRVIDFIDFHVWPVFNVADASIVVGALFLLLVGLRDEREER
ncbi:MAG TPA: signal peptidase II [Actinomycetota bacterium]|jgi:signal peptidase II|nr:signal peptidase II [Actinomycetota bacterium]